MSAEAAAVPVAAPAAAPPPQPELDGGENAFSDAPEDEGGDFDVEDLRKQARAALRAGRKAYSDEEEETETPEPEKPEKAPPKPKAEAKKADPQEDPDDAEHRKKLLDKDGKLDNDKISDSFAALRRKIREHDAAVKKFETERQGWESKASERDAWKAEKQAHEEWKANARSSPLVALKEAGWSLEQLTEYVAKNGQVPASKLVSDQEAARTASEAKLLKEVEELRTSHQQLQDKLQAEQYITRTRGELRTGVDSGKYPLVADYMKRGVFDFEYLSKQTLDNIANAWAGKDGNGKRILDVQTLLAQYEGELAEARKVHGGSGAVQAAEDPEAAKPVTNEATSERTRRRSEDDGLWTEDDAIEARKKALAMLRG